MIRLYEHPLSPYAQKIKIALAEKDLAFEAVTPNLVEGDPDWERDNPRREVPMLVDEGTRVFDSTVILEYLEDRSPEPALLPASPAERARVRMLEDLCDTYVEAINWGAYEVRYFGRAPGALGETLLARAADQWSGVHAWLERELGARPWFNGERFGWGDLSVFPFAAAAAGLGFAPAAGSSLAAWLARAGDRESTRRCLDAAAAAMAAFEQIPALIQSGAWVREYRDHRLEWMIRSGGADVVLDGLSKRNIRFTLELG